MGGFNLEAAMKLHTFRPKHLFWTVLSYLSGPREYHSQSESVLSPRTQHRSSPTRTSTAAMIDFLDSIHDPGTHPRMGLDLDPTI
jgi:hypothetical protein